MARPKSTSASASESARNGKAGGGGGGGRTSNPPRAAAAKKRVSYAEQEGDEDDGWQGEEGDTTLVDEEDGEDELVSSFDIGDLVKAFSKSRTKKEKTEAAKIEKQMDEILADGQKEVDSFVAVHKQKADTFIASLALDKTPSLTRLDPDNYRRAFAEQQQLTRQLAAAIDDEKQSLDPEQDPFFAAAKQALEGRPKRAKRAYKKLAKTSAVVLEERRAMAEMKQASTQEVYRHLKALTRL
ncbi:hypothetical protein JCM10213_002542 [Rhodosporidiobolus nylandii]